MCRKVRELSWVLKVLGVENSFLLRTTSKKHYRKLDSTNVSACLFCEYKKLHSQQMCGRNNTQDAWAIQWPKKKAIFHSTMQYITFMNCVWMKFWLSHVVVIVRQINKSPTCHNNYMVYMYCMLWLNVKFCDLGLFPS